MPGVTSPLDAEMHDVVVVSKTKTMAVMNVNQAVGTMTTKMAVGSWMTTTTPTTVT
jgi:hypothetical protein